MKYRPHRGSLFDSMSEVVEISNRQALLHHINNNSMILKRIKLQDEDLKLSSQGYDKRINWNTYIVCIRNKLIGLSNEGDEIWYFGKEMGPDYFGAIGYTNEVC